MTGTETKFSSEFKDLIRCLLRFDASQRLTTQDVIKHPWVTRLPPMYQNVWVKETPTIRAVVQDMTILEEVDDSQALTNVRADSEHASPEPQTTPINMNGNGLDSEPLSHSLTNGVTKQRRSLPTFVHESSASVEWHSALLGAKSQKKSRRRRKSTGMDSENSISDVATNAKSLKKRTRGSSKSSEDREYLNQVISEVETQIREHGMSIEEKESEHLEQNQEYV